jgi:hypothetical protein
MNILYLPGKIGITSADRSPDDSRHPRHQHLLAARDFSLPRSRCREKLPAPRAFRFSTGATRAR